jgi:hypothetical protein
MFIPWSNAFRNHATSEALVSTHIRATGSAASANRRTRAKSATPDLKKATSPYTHSRAWWLGGAAESWQPHLSGGRQTSGWKIVDPLHQHVWRNSGKFEAVCTSMSTPSTHALIMSICWKYRNMCFLNARISYVWYPMYYWHLNREKED